MQSDAQVQRILRQGSEAVPVLSDLNVARVCLTCARYGGLTVEKEVVPLRAAG